MSSAASSQRWLRIASTQLVSRGAAGGALALWVAADCAECGPVSIGGGAPRAQAPSARAMPVRSKKRGIDDHVVAAEGNLGKIMSAPLLSHASSVRELSAQSAIRPST